MLSLLKTLEYPHGAYSILWYVYYNEKLLMFGTNSTFILISSLQQNKSLPNLINKMSDQRR